MKFSHNNATHLDISKYIRLQCVCVKVIFVETFCYLFMSHSYSTYYVRTYGVLYIDLSITWQMRIPDAFFRIFDAHINPYWDRKTNNSTINSSKFWHKNRWIHFICFRKTDPHLIDVGWVTINVQIIKIYSKLRFVQQINSIRFIFIHFKISP